MIELLAIKDGERYLRFQGDDFELCAMAKATVYPLAQQDQVYEKLRTCQAQGLTEAVIVKLTIHEEDFTL